MNTPKTKATVETKIIDTLIQPLISLRFVVYPKIYIIIYPNAKIHKDNIHHSHPSNSWNKGYPYRLEFHPH